MVLSLQTTAILICFKMKLVALLFFFLLFSTYSFTQSYKKVENVAQCKKSIQDKQKSMKSLTADFKETVYSSMFETPQKGSGKLFYKQSQKIRWEKTEPKKSVILINGKTIKLSENGKEVTNPTSKTIVKKIQSMMVQMLSGDFLSEKDFSIEYFENTNNYKLILTPKNERMSRYIEQVELIFDKKALTLSEMSMIEEENEKIVFSFSNIQVNASINDNKFINF